MSLVSQPNPPSSPVHVLLHETDPIQRSRAHLALGQRALARHDSDSAVVHLEEASELDPTDEVPRQLLEGLVAPRKSRKWWFW